MGNLRDRGFISGFIPNAKLYDEDGTGHYGTAHILTNRINNTPNFKHHNNPSNNSIGDFIDEFPENTGLLGDWAWDIEALNKAKECYNDASLYAIISIGSLLIFKVEGKDDFIINNDDY